MLPLHVSLSLRTGVFRNWPKEMNWFSLPASAKEWEW